MKWYVLKWNQFLNLFHGLLSFWIKQPLTSLGTVHKIVYWPLQWWYGRNRILTSLWFHTHHNQCAATQCCRDRFDSNCPSTGRKLRLSWSLVMKFRRKATCHVTILYCRVGCEVKVHPFVGLVIFVVPLAIVSDESHDWQRGPWEVTVLGFATVCDCIFHR